MKGQLKELLTGYGPIGLFGSMAIGKIAGTYDRGVDLYKYIRRIQPDIIVNNRVGQDRNGKACSPTAKFAWVITSPRNKPSPPTVIGPGVDWETCMTMNDTWGYKRSDDNWKSTDPAIHNLIDITSKGGNYLLNVGPTAKV